MEVALVPMGWVSARLPMNKKTATYPMKTVMKKDYVLPSVLQTSDILLESDLLTGSIRDRFQVVISGQETGGFYDYEGTTGDAIDDIWTD